MHSTQLVQQSGWNGQQVPRGMSKFVGMLVLRSLQSLSTSCLYSVILSGEGAVMVLLCVLHLAERPYEIP